MIFVQEDKTNEEESDPQFQQFQTDATASV